MNRDLPDFQYRGARAMVILHERYLREFVEVWKRARISGVKLPQTDDPSYQSWDTLLKHLIRAARGYMVWTCEKLELSDPQINIPTEPEVFAADVDRILEHVLDKWWRPLAICRRSVSFSRSSSRAGRWSIALTRCWSMPSSTRCGTHCSLRS